MRYVLKNGEVEDGRDPKHQIKHQSTKKFCQHNLPVADRGGHEGLNGSQFKFLRKDAHRNKRKYQNEGKPEEHRVKKRFLHRIRYGALIHERDLEVKIYSANQKEKDENDVGNRGVEVTRYLPREQSEELTHRLYELGNASILL